MKVSQLTLCQFRNVSESVLEPGSHLNFLLGSNGQGKTSFLEALGFLSTLRSFRGSKAHEVIQWKKEQAEIFCELSSIDVDENLWKTNLKIFFCKQNEEKASKIATINGKKYKNSTQYLSQRFGSYQLGFHAVVFNPSDHELIRGEPTQRRAYIDRVLSANDVDYLKAIHRYHRLLEQKNSILKSQQPVDLEVQKGFLEPLAKVAAEITLKRLHWFVACEQPLNTAAQNIQPGQPKISQIYHSSFFDFNKSNQIVNSDINQNVFAGHRALPSLEQIEQAFWEKQNSIYAAEWRAGHALIGPQRDDWMFYLGSRSLKGHGSQGEIRSTLMALKLSEIELFRKATGHRPVFLLDDFSSELDSQRRKFLLNYLAETDLQVFITTTEVAEYPGKRFLISEGQVKEEA